MKDNLPNKNELILLKLPKKRDYNGNQKDLNHVYKITIVSSLMYVIYCHCLVFSIIEKLKFGYPSLFLLITTEHTGAKDATESS